jgi:hypothetical protein
MRAETRQSTWYKKMAGLHKSSRCHIAQTQPIFFDQWEKQPSEPNDL